MLVLRAARSFLEESQESPTRVRVCDKSVPHGVLKTVKQECQPTFWPFVFAYVCAFGFVGFYLVVLSFFEENIYLVPRRAGNWFEVSQCLVSPVPGVDTFAGETRGHRGTSSAARIIHRNGVEHGFCNSISMGTRRTHIESWEPPCFVLSCLLSSY